VALEQGFLRRLRFLLSVSFHRGSPYPYIWSTVSQPMGWDPKVGRGEHSDGLYVVKIPFFNFEGT
jgi:hypothetical protein